MNVHVSAEILEPASPIALKQIQRSRMMCGEVAPPCSTMGGAILQDRALVDIGLVRCLARRERRQLIPNGNGRDAIAGPCRVVVLVKDPRR
jgi:hypothetical protein